MHDVQELNLPDDLPDYDQLPELPDVIPDWVIFDPIAREMPTCDCCGHRHDNHDEQVLAEPVGPDITQWPTEPGLPAPSSNVLALQAAVTALEQVEATALGSAQALVDAQLLLQLEQQLRVQDLRRIADVKGRALHDLAGYRSTKTWLKANRPDGDGNDADLAGRLLGLPRLSAAVQQHRVPLASARKVAAVLRKIGPHLDRTDGLIDGRPGEQVMAAVLPHLVTLLCRDLQGLHDDDPRLAAILAQADALAEQAERQGDSQAARVEAAFIWLAEQIPSRGLSGPLDELLVAILPSKLEEREDRGHERRSLDLRPLPDGEGWHVCGDLDLECGERLWTALRAEAARDLRNPSDTEAWEEQRQAGTDDDVWGIRLGTLPRSRRQRLHDAMSRLLERYLAAGLGGLSGKAPVQIHVTVSEPTVTGDRAALPPRADSGRLIPKAMVRRWWCDSSVTAYVLSLGGKALRVVHGQRTLTAQERRALATEGGGRCAGDGCCPSSPDALVVLRPHHLLGYNEDQITSLEETIPVCDTLHHDLHDGKKTVRLRDGRYLDEHGYRDGPALDDPPPF